MKSQRSARMLGFLLIAANIAAALAVFLTAREALAHDGEHGSASQGFQYTN